MIPIAFGYVAPKSASEAVAFLVDNPGSCAIAGGLDLLTQIKLKSKTAAHIVDLKNLEELRKITLVAGSAGSEPVSPSIIIGSMVTCNGVSENQYLQEMAAALVEAARSVGDAQTRNVSTLGGNIVNCDPASDFAACVLALGGRLHVLGAKGRRIIESDQFFQGPRSNPLAGSDLLVAIELPSSSGKSGSAYSRFKNVVNCYPLCGVAAKVALQDDGKKILWARVAVTGAGLFPQRLKELEEKLAGRPVSGIAGLCKGVVSKIDVRTDIYASGEYRAHLADILAARAISSALSQAAG